MTYSGCHGCVLLSHTIIYVLNESVGTSCKCSDDGKALPSVLRMRSCPAAVTTHTEMHIYDIIHTKEESLSPFCVKDRETKFEESEFFPHPVMCFVYTYMVFGNDVHSTCIVWNERKR